MNEGIFCSAVVPLSDVSSLKPILLLYVANIRLWSREVSQSVMELDASWTLCIISLRLPACWSKFGHYCRLSQVPFLQILQTVCRMFMLMCAAFPQVEEQALSLC